MLACLNSSGAGLSVSWSSVVRYSRSLWPARKCRGVGHERNSVIHFFANGHSVKENGTAEQGTRLFIHRPQARPEIEFRGGHAGPRKGNVTLETVLRTLIERESKL
jgi:hypothetical protein